jgi:hypothetical protein
MIRRAVLAAGVVALAFGAEQFLTLGPAPQVLSALLWMAAVLVVHDGVVAPLTVGVGRLVSRWGGRTVGVGLAVGVVVLAGLALPALLSPGLPDNPTVLPRAYGRGLVLLLAADVAVTVAVAIIRRRRAARTAARRGTGPP